MKAIIDRNLVGRKKLKGVEMEIRGRIRGKDRASKKEVEYGKQEQGNRLSKITYGEEAIITKYGVLNVRVKCAKEVIDKKKRELEREMKEGLRKTGGRNNTGRITVRHRGGGHKRNYRVLEQEERTGIVKSVEYTPNRTGYVGKCEVYGGREVYKIIGEQEQIQREKELLIGTTLKVIKLKDLKVGTWVYNVAQRPGQRGKIGRASGVGCIVIKQEEKVTVLRMPSKEVKSINNESTGTIGRVAVHEVGQLGKAGKNRRLGIRPSVRGTAMNAVDHPNGGKTGGGQSRTPWGQLAKWIPTRRERRIRH